MPSLSILMDTILKRDIISEAAAQYMWSKQNGMENSSHSDVLYRPTAQHSSLPCYWGPREQQYPSGPPASTAAWGVVPGSPASCSVHVRQCSLSHPAPLIYQPASSSSPSSSIKLYFSYPKFGLIYIYTHIYINIYYLYSDSPRLEILRPKCNFRVYFIWIEKHTQEDEEVLWGPEVIVPWKSHGEALGAVMQWWKGGKWRGKDGAAGRNHACVETSTGVSAARRRTGVGRALGSIQESQKATRMGMVKSLSISQVLPYNWAKLLK